MHVLLVHVSGTPPWYLGPYGNDWVLTPVLNALAAEGVVFDRHEADGPVPMVLPRLLETGRHSFVRPPEPDAHCGLDALHHCGVSTLLLTALSTSSLAWQDASRLDLGCTLAEVQNKVRHLLETLAERQSGLLVLDLAGLDFAGDDELAEAEEVSDKDEQDSTEEADPETLALLGEQAVVAGQVEGVDAFIGWLLGELQQADLEKDTLIVFSSEAGRGTADGLCSAGPDHPLRPSMTALGLILRFPENVHAGERITALTQPADLLPTLLEWLGQKNPAEIHGKSLLPLCRGDADAVRPYACARAADTSGAASLTSSEWKLLVKRETDSPPRRWLFRQPEDRFGMNDLHQHFLDFAERLEQCLEGYFQALDQLGPMVIPSLPAESEEERPHQEV